MPGDSFDLWLEFEHWEPQPGDDPDRAGSVRIDAGTLEVYGESGTYGTFNINESIYLVNGTLVSLTVDGQVGAGQRADKITSSNGGVWQVPVGAAMQLSISTDNGSPPNTTQYTIISGYEMDINPNKNGRGQLWGTMAVGGNYGGGKWVAAISGNSIFIQAQSGGTSPVGLAPALASDSSSAVGAGRPDPAVVDSLFGAFATDWLAVPASRGQELPYGWEEPTASPPDVTDRLMATLSEGLA